MTSEESKVTVRLGAFVPSRIAALGLSDETPMTQKNEVRKAASDLQHLLTGFERTLAPSDPGLAAPPASGYRVRDNRRGVVLSSARAPLDGGTQGHPTEFGRDPVSGTPISGVKVSSAVRLRADIPISELTREEDAEHAARDTVRDAVLAESEAQLDVTPDFASEYVPPQPLPVACQHKTFELRPVRLDPEVHPRTAPTVLNARAAQRRHDKQIKDARELAWLEAQAHRRQRGPWIALAFLSVIALGFLVGTDLVDSSQAGAELQLAREQPMAIPVQAPAEAPRPGQAKVSAEAASGTARKDEPSKPEQPKGLLAPASPSLPAETGSTARSARRATEPLRQGSTPTTTSTAVEKRAGAGADAIAEPAPRAKPLREVWLK